jgi:hypothetical protein
LRLLLDREGVGVELPREAYEAGDWANTVEEAWAKGREMKMRCNGRGLWETDRRGERDGTESSGLGSELVGWLESELEVDGVQGVWTLRKTWT